MIITWEYKRKDALFNVAISDVFVLLSITRIRGAFLTFVCTSRVTQINWMK
jgi:hypothetical protein